MSQENLQIVRSIYEAFARQDIPALVNALDPKVEWRLADNWIYADRNPLIGPQAAILEGPISRLAKEWEGFSVTPETLLDAGDHIVALGVYTGTYKSTRKQVRAQFAHIWTLARGKVRELLELALQTHGGLDRWREVQSLDIHVSLTGALRLELERQNARLRLLLDLTNRITSNLDLRELPRAISARPKVVLAAPLSTICECAMENANPCFVLTPSPTVTRNRSSSNHSPPPLPLNTAKNSTFQQIAARRRLLTICNLTLMDLVDVWARWQRGMVATSSHDTLNVIFLRRKGDAHAFRPSGRCTTGRAGVQSRPIALTEDARPLAEGEI